MWDPALPPGGLDRVMQQYDNIRSHATRDEGPPWEDPEEDPQPAKKEEVKQAPPDPPQTQEAPARDLRLPPQQQAPADVSGFITPAKEDDGKVTVERPAPPQQVLSDATQPRPLGRPKSWQTSVLDMHMKELGQRRFFYDLVNPGRSSFRRD